jgi:MFS family permease
MESIEKNLFPDGYVHNLSIVYLFTFSSQFSRAIFEGNVMSSYIYLISNHSNFIVGSLTGLNGLVQLLCSPLTGWAADKFPRTLILKIASIIGFVSVFFTMYAVYEAKLILFTICMGLWGVFWAFTAPTTDALLADCVNTGSRSLVYSTRLSLIQISSSFGPALSAILFASLGDSWSREECAVVMLTGLILYIPSCILLQCFQSSSENEKVSLFISKAFKKLARLRRKVRYDQLPLHEVELYAQSSHDHDRQLSLNKALIDFPDDDLNEVSIKADELETISDKLVEDTPSTEPSTPASSPSPSPPLVEEGDGQPFVLFIPLMIALSDVITGLASGMTIKFFPIYFMKDLHMSPIAVSLLYMVNQHN